MSQRTTFVLRNSKASELGPQAMEQVFASLPYTPSPLLSFLPGFYPDPIAFEIVVFNQSIYFQINTPIEHEHYLKSQLVAAYPGLSIDEAPDHHKHLHPLFEGQLAVTNLTLSNGEFYPLKTYVDFSETDPLSAVLGNLSKLGPGQSAIVQLLLATDSDRWKNRGYRLAEGYTDKEGKNIANPDKPLIEFKLGQTCHRYALTIATSAADINLANTALNNLVGSYAPFTFAKSNSFNPHKPLFGKKKLMETLPHRSFEGTTKQHLSISELSTIWHMPYMQVKDVKNISWGRTLLGEPPEGLSVFSEVSEAEKDKVNFFAQTEYKNQMQVYGIKHEDRRRHMYIIGKSGTGKSTLLGNMIVNDLKHGKGMAVVDPHGDLAEAMLDYIPSDRINDVVYLNPADPEYTVRINLLEDTGHQYKELIASGVIAIFKKLYGHSWGPRLEYILRNTLLTLVEKDQATMEDIVKILTDNKFLERTLEKIQDPVLKNFWEKEFMQMQDKQKVEAISPILNKIGQFVTSPMIRHVINSPTSSFSIEDVMNQGKILICNLSQGKLGEDNAAMMGAMLITKIQLAAMNRVYMAEEDRKDFVLYVDEFQNFATTSFIKILSEARKYRLSLVLANQYVEQIEPEIRAAIFGNCGSLITFLVGAGDAALLSQEFGQQYTPEDLVSIQNHQIVQKLMVNGTQSTPFPGWTLPPADSKNENREKVIRVSNERYAKKKISHKIQGTSDKSKERQKPVEGKAQNSKTKSKNQNSNPKSTSKENQVSLDSGATQNQLQQPQHQEQIEAQTHQVSQTDLNQYTPEQWLAYYQANPHMIEQYKEHYEFVVGLVQKK